MPKDKYTCQLCQNHGLFDVPKKGHKQNCPYKTCTCPRCILNTKRRELDQRERQARKETSQEEPLMASGPAQEATPSAQTLPGTDKSPPPSTIGKSTAVRATFRPQVAGHPYQRNPLPYSIALLQQLQAHPLSLLLRPKFPGLYPGMPFPPPPSASIFRSAELLARSQEPEPKGPSDTSSSPADSPSE